MRSPTGVLDARWRRCVWLVAVALVVATTTLAAEGRASAQAPGSATSTALPAQVGPVAFDDVGRDHAFHAEITWTANVGIAEGYEDDTYRPVASVTRQALVAFLYRAAGQPAFTPPAEATFPDVPMGHTFFAEIEWAVAEGIVQGYADGTFGPDRMVSRQATAAFLYRSDEAEAPAPAEATFPDVPVGHAFSAEIEWMVAEGLTTGYGDGTFGPVNDVTRQAAAAFLLRIGCDCPDTVLPEVRDNPPAPEPETVALERLPLPPAPTDGVCDLTVNVQGCVVEPGSIGGFLDAATVVGVVGFGGAPDTGFDGNQLIAVRVDGSTFPNGTPWKCLTCDMPEENRPGVGLGREGEYPQPFNDGRRVLLGDTILECEAALASQDCTPEVTYRYPIRWNTTPDGSGPGGSMRELRIHPDDVHLGWSSLAQRGTKLDQFMYYGRLEFNPAPTTGEPAVPRYDLVNVNLMYDPDQPGAFSPDPDDQSVLRYTPMPEEVGEFRRWSTDGQWAAYVGVPTSSNRIDMFMIHLETGEVRPLTRHPEYTDPMAFSYDMAWTVQLDTRTGGGGANGADRQRFMSAMPGIPPLTDLISTSFVSSVRNDGQRRFFQPILIDIHADRGDYEGQALKDSCPEGPAPGNLCDPEWGARADPHFSLDSTAIVYREHSHGVAAPDAVTGRTGRWVIARLVDRDPVPYTPPAPAADWIPWATPYTPGDPEPFRSTLVPPAGSYTLHGPAFGRAEVTIEHDTTSGPTTVVGEVSVTYHNFSQDGVNVINGTERVTRLPAPQSTLTHPALEWESDLSVMGYTTGTKVTVGPDGRPGPFRGSIDLFQTILFSEGDLVSTIDGVTYTKHPMGPNHRPFADR